MRCSLLHLELEARNSAVTSTRLMNVSLIVDRCCCINGGAFDCTSSCSGCQFVCMDLFPSKLEPLAGYLAWESPDASNHLPSEKLGLTLD